MPLSNKEIIELSGYSAYYEGQAYFKKNRVKIIENNNGYVAAEVYEKAFGKPCHTQVKFTADGDDLSFCECECWEYDEVRESICKHVVAVILKAQTLSLVPKVKKSDNSAVTLLNTYIQGIADRAVESQAGQAVFEAVLERDGSSLNASFRVGEQRMYIVQDLAAFLTRFHNRSSSAYGKYNLWHSIASFCEESRPLVEFFLKHYNGYNYIYGNRYGYYNSKRNMFFSPLVADEFFDLFEGKDIAVREDHKKINVIPVVRKDYRPHLSLKKEAEGAALTLNDQPAALQGDKYMYVMTNDCVYCCSKDFAIACNDLLRIFAESKESMFFAESEIGLLFSTVLSKAMPFVKLETEGEFETYKPLPLIVKIYLDSPGTNSVTARMTFTYGEKTIESFGQKDLTVSHDIAGEIRAERLLAKYFTDSVLHNGDNTLHIENNANAVYLLISEGLDEFSRIAELYTTDAFGRIKLRPPAVVTVGVRVSADLLQLDFELEGIDLSELPEVLASYREAKKYHRLRDGSFLMLEENALSGLSELAEGLDLNTKQLTNGSAEMASSRALYLDAICKKNEEIRIDRDRSFKKMLRDMREVENADFPVPAELQKILRNYQKTGFSWLKTITAYGFGGILADDMGLGKTLQILALFKSYYDETEKEQRLPSIVVCPSSLMLNWESEVQKFTPDLHAAVITGLATERAAMIDSSAEYDLMITSYDLLKRDVDLYEKLHFRFVVIDEAQYIKNQTTQNAKSVKALNGQTRLALTGTPVENSLAELWSIVDFLMPGYLFAYNRFKKKYETPIVRKNDEEASARLKQLVRPFLLRRLKSDVLKELPPKTETILCSSMDDEQKKLYIANLAQARKDISARVGLGAGQDRILILAALTKMRQICCDPALLYENYGGGSVKLEMCMELIENCIQSGRRMLLFSQFTSMLNIIGQRLNELGVEYFRIDGSTKSSSRLELVNTFNSGSAPIFLISLKAGGTGLNLTGADVVIHYDPWWNLSAQNQATDRAHRIGQKNSVQVYKLIVKDTIEERILTMQERKADLANTVIEENSDPFTQLNREELLSLFEEASV